MCCGVQTWPSNSYFSVSVCGVCVCLHASFYKFVVSGGFGTRWMTDLINNIVKEGCIPDDWRKSILVPVYNGKGDSVVCSSYRDIRLMEQPMKVPERVLENRSDVN